MAGWNGSGSFSISFPDFVAGTTIVSTQVDTNNSDFVTGLMHCLTVNGETVPTANLPMATFKHTGVGNASARDQYAAAGQVQDSAFHWVNAAGVTGTADAILLAPSPAITAYAEGQIFRFRAEATSTSATPTVNVSSVGAKTIQKDGGALAVGDIVNARWYEIFYDGTNFQLRNISLAAAAGSAALLASANTFTANQTIQSTDAGAAIGPTLILDRDSASPADGDVIGGILFRGEDESGGDDDYATIQGEIVDATGGTEDGRIGFLTKIAGTEAARAYVGAGIYTAGVSDPGANKINATALQMGGEEIDGVATQAEQEAGTDVAKVVTSGRQHHHISAAKAWGVVDRSAGTPSLGSPSYNITSVTDNGAANTTVTIATDFSSIIYVIAVTSHGVVDVVGATQSVAAGAFDVKMTNVGGGGNDTASFDFVCFGDQA